MEPVTIKRRAKSVIQGRKECSAWYKKGEMKIRAEYKETVGNQRQS